MKTFSHISATPLIPGALAIFCLCGLSNYSTAAVITLPSVPVGSIGGELFNSGSFGDTLTVGPWNGSLIPFTPPSDSTSVVVSAGLSYGFTFSYDQVANKYEFTAAGETVEYFAYVVSAKDFILKLNGANNHSVAVNGLSLTGGTLDPSIDINYSLLGSGSPIYSIPTTGWMTEDFELTGTFTFTAPGASPGNKVGFEIFIAQAVVPEPASIAFGAVLVGGLVMMELRRRKTAAQAS